jgi:hypothetical protein
MAGSSQGAAKELARAFFIKKERDTFCPSTKALHSGHSRFLPAKNLAFVGADGRWTLEEGDFLLRVGRLTVPTACRETKIWNTPNI